uniref:ATP synthase complex subunit 8 n=1 Tax=Buergeria buergeri TaxID=191197 RepID=Q6L7I3_BUEBU|nr:ATPase 8 [Buergeria buergeri]
MPQLNPDPWFITFILAWTILLSLAPMKILSYTELTEPSTKSIKTSPLPWIWPWQ